MNTFRTGYVLFLAALGSVASPHSFAAGASLEEVIVTANKRETTLMETAGSLSAYDGDTMDLLGIETGADLAVRTPSLTITTFRVAIRGVGRPNLAVGSEPGIGLYWDGVYTTDNDVFNFSRYMDIERVEVLRGPQGTLYGRNSIGGAISFYSQRPTAEWSGKVVGEVANYDGRVLQGLVSGPVTDKLGILAAVSSLRRDGFQENIFNGNDYQQQDQQYATLAFEYQANDRWNTNLKLIGADANFHQSAGYILEPFSRELVQPGINPDTGLPNTFPGIFPGNAFVNMRQGLKITNPALDDVDKVKVDTDPVADIQRASVFLNSEYAADTFTIKYTGSYSRLWYDTISDADHSVSADSGIDWNNYTFLGLNVATLTGFGLTPSNMTTSVNQTARYDSHEIQFLSDWEGDFGLITGLYYYHSDEDQVVDFRELNDDLMAVYAFFGPFVPAGAAPVSDDNFLYRGVGKVDTRSYAAFGQVTWDWTEKTELTFGLRYSYDEKKGGDNTFVQFVGDADDPVVFREEEDTWDEPTWRVGIEHMLTDEHFFYGFVATGYRSGGFNFLKPTSSTDVDVVQPEHLLSYEIGYKGSLMDNRVNVGISAYYYDYEDLQILKQDVVNGIGVNTFSNAEQANAFGVELEWQALLRDHWLLSGTYSYNDTEFEDFFSKDANACTLGPVADNNGSDPLCQDELDLKGNEFALTPDHSASLNLTYLWGMLAWDWSATASYLYRGDQWSTEFNNDEYDRVDDWSQVDVRVTAISEEQEWQLTAFVRNISDDRATIGRGRPSTVTQNAQTQLTNPRIYGFTAQYNF
ncbi:MAG: iron complex outermembrane receptor protein [Halioglobus sp.]|jgi:iron complex outermembrane receptor protein